ncbi:MAG TPA: nuclear transport factor 2 family protein [Nitrospirota bacterium]|nr:nuclear transport factor 2 family protein [Nitrospirota bacterium]
MNRMIRVTIATAVMLFLQAPDFSIAEQKDEVVRFVIMFYDQVVNKKDFEAASKYLAPRYIQHNQRAADGAEGLKNFIAQLREKYPQAHSKIKRAFRDGNYVILQVHAVREPGSAGMAVVDIFRLEHGKIAEHWDVHEDILKEPANNNGVF